MCVYVYIGAYLCRGPGPTRPTRSSSNSLSQDLFSSLSLSRATSSLSLSDVFGSSTAAASSNSTNNLSNPNNHHLYSPTSSPRSANSHSSSSFSTSNHQNNGSISISRAISSRFGGNENNKYENNYNSSAYQQRKGVLTTVEGSLKRHIIWTELIYWQT